MTPATLDGRVSATGLIKPAPTTVPASPPQDSPTTSQGATISAPRGITPAPTTTTPVHHQYLLLLQRNPLSLCLTLKLLLVSLPLCLGAVCHCANTLSSTSDCLCHSSSSGRSDFICLLIHIYCFLCISSSYSTSPV